MMNNLLLRQAPSANSMQKCKSGKIDESTNNPFQGETPPLFSWPFKDTLNENISEWKWTAGGH